MAFSCQAWRNCWTLLGILAWTALTVNCAWNCTDEEYLQNWSLLVRLDGIADRYPDLASVHSIGVSATGVELRVLKLSAANEDALVPDVKLIGGIHGNEPPSTHVLLNLAEHLLAGYQSGDRYIHWLLNNVRLHILPRLNPDGFSSALEGECNYGPGRRNARGVDLNRGFPRAVSGDRGPVEGSEEDSSSPGFEREVDAVMNWFETVKFTLSASLHTGALVAVYPLDSPIRGGPKMDLYDYIDNLDLATLLSEDSKESTLKNIDVEDETKGTTPDDDVFRHLAQTYASNHRTMASGHGCEKDHFPGGIVNGAEWFAASGTMMDYNYHFAGTMELTLELYCCKYPPPRFICPIWEQNALALVKYVGEAVRGVRGKVSSGGIPLENALVRVLDRDLGTFTNSRGHFFRILLPGSYFLQVEMVGMESRIVPFEVYRQETAFYNWTELNVELLPEGAGDIAGGQAYPVTGGPGDKRSMFDSFDPMSSPSLPDRLLTNPPSPSSGGPQSSAETQSSETQTSLGDAITINVDWITPDEAEYEIINDTSTLTRKVIYSQGTTSAVQTHIYYMQLVILLILYLNNVKYNYL